MIRTSDYATATGSTKKPRSIPTEAGIKKRIEPVYTLASFTFFHSINLLIRQLRFAQFIERTARVKRAKSIRRATSSDNIGQAREEKKWQLKS